MIRPSKMWTIIVIISCALHSLAGAAYLNSFSGPFDIVFHKMELCPSSTGKEHVLVDVNPARLMRDRHNKYGLWYNGVVTFFEDFTDDVYAEMNMASWSSRGGWTPNAYRFHADRLCSLFLYVIPYLPEGQARNFSNALGKNSIDEIVCPFPKGIYTIKGMYWNVDISHLMPPIVPYGKWRDTVTIAKDKKSPMEFCFKLYFDTVPKPGGKTGKFASHFNVSILSGVISLGGRPM